MARDSAGRRGSGSRRVGRARATASEAGRCRDAATPARDGRRSSAPCGTRGTPPRRFRRAPATRAPRRRAHRARPAPPATALAPPRSSRTARGPASSPPPRPSWAPGRYQGTPQAVTLPTRNPEEPVMSGAGRVIEQAQQLGLQDYIEKPVCPELLLAMLERYCDQEY